MPLVRVFCLFHKKMASLTFLKMDLNRNSKLQGVMIQEIIHLFEFRFWTLFNSSNWTKFEIGNRWTVTVRWILFVWSYLYNGITLKCRILEQVSQLLVSHFHLQWRFYTWICISMNLNSVNWKSSYTYSMFRVRRVMLPLFNFFQTPWKISFNISIN